MADLLGSRHVPPMHAVEFGAAAACRRYFRALKGAVCR